MFSRRGFIQVSTGAAASLALRGVGVLPALAQSGADYRALVCVFLFGGNDSNNTIVPMDTASYKAYQSIRGSLALSGTELTPVTSVSGAPYGFHAAEQPFAAIASQWLLPWPHFARMARL